MASDRQVWKMIFDFIILALVGFALLALSLWATPYHRGYFPQDVSLYYPYKEQTVSEGLLAGVGFGLMVATIILVELVRDKQGSGIGEKFLGGSLVSGWIWESYYCIGIFTFGAACQHLTSNLAKYVIGRLRPHFFDLCRPLADPDSEMNRRGYIVDYTCQGTDEEKLENMRLSFPSAHASFAMYTAVFFILYIQEKGRWRGSKLLRHTFQYAVFLGAFYVGLSRIVDHMHHPSDVAVGFFVGAAYGILVFKCVLKPKKYGAPRMWEDPVPNNTLPRPVLAPAMMGR